MPDPSMLGVFLIASIALLVIPGPAVMYIVARGIHQGRSAALVSTLGIEVGTFIQLLLATAGLASLVASSDLAFSTIKGLGALYLFWLALSTLLSRGSHLLSEDMRVAQSLRSVFLQGVLVETLNLKTALFFLVFLPQFADPKRGPVEGQMLMLGGLFIALAVVHDGLVGLLSGMLGGWLRDSTRFLRAQRYVSGSIYGFLAVQTTLSGAV